MCGAKWVGVDVDRVPARGLDDLDAGVEEPVAEILEAADAVAEIVLVHDLGETLGHGLQVAAREPAVGHESFGEDEQVACAAEEVGVADAGAGRRC
jgi:hypothetical protein